MPMIEPEDVQKDEIILDRRGLLSNLLNDEPE